MTSFDEPGQRDNFSATIFARVHEVTVVYASIALLSSVFGVCGNLLVIVVAYRNRRHISACKLHIAQLAVVNFVFCTLQVYFSFLSSSSFSLFLFYLDTQVLIDDILFLSLFQGFLFFFFCQHNSLFFSLDEMFCFSVQGRPRSE